MRRCTECGVRVRRRPPETVEYGMPAIDGLRYPDRCPNCDASIA
ncbi:hypothetical protein ACNS7O_14285 [Haloferacaceae archaeon DSL9]